MNVLGFPHISQPGPVATVANSTGPGRPWHRCPLSHGSLHTVIIVRIVIIVIYSSYALCTFVIIPKKVNCVNCLGIFGTSVWHFSCWAQNLRTCMRQQSFIEDRFRVRQPPKRNQKPCELVVTNYTDCRSVSVPMQVCEL